MRMKKKVKKKLIITLVIILVIVLAVGGYFVYNKFLNTPATKAKVVDKIEDYGYELESDAPKVYKKLFGELVTTLKADPVDDEAYAKLVAQMVAVDFYNLDNKVSKNDVGGTQFILSAYKDNFVLEASDTVYKYLEHNLYNDRKQDLPEINDVSIKEIKKIEYSYGKVKDSEAYQAVVGLNYKEDLGYPSEVTVKMVHVDKKLEVFYMK